MVISILKIVAIADLTHFSVQKCTGTVFKGFYQIFFFNDGKVLLF